MKDETQHVLDEFEKELWEDDLLKDMPKSLLEKQKDDDIDQIMAEILADMNLDTEPAFEDPDKLHYSDGPDIYCNYSNDYGNSADEQAEYADEDVEAEIQEKKSEDKWLITLMGVASALCVGIIGVLVYWMEVFLK